jgi:dihydrofolate synthase/folylpolyglutamate synthase
LYTSPHLKDFRERIKINGQPCPEEFVTGFTEKMKPHIETLHPSFFEVTVAMAFAHFAKHNVDFAVIETGLGGRLDSTNIITPVLSVITNISLEHTQILGDTLEKIAWEKAGIIKPAIPVVIGRRQAETENVYVDKAREQGSKIYFADELDQVCQKIENNILVCGFKRGKEIITASTDLTASYQVENIRTVVRSFLVLQETEKIPIKKALQGVKNTQRSTGLMGRWQKLSEHPDTIIDGAHNPDGIQHLMQQLKKESYNKVHIVFGMVKDKDAEAVLRLLPADAVYYFTQPALPRALSANELLGLAARQNKHGTAYASSHMALKAARDNAGAGDLVLVTGSLFLVGELV